MRKSFWIVLLGLGVFLLASPVPAVGFTTLPIFNNGTDTPDDDLADAGRWSDERGTFVDDNVRGLGGGLEYSIAQDFYDKMLPAFVDSTSRSDITQAIQRAFNRWANGSPLTFRDISARIPAIRDAASPGSGSEIDIFAVPGTSIDFVNTPLSGNTLQQFNSNDPMGTNGRTLSGRTLTSADILINQDRMYYLNANDPEVQRLQGQGQFLVHFESLILHEIGHAIGLDHPDIWWNRNFDNDSNGNNAMNINCNSPSQGLSVSTNFNRNAVMTAEGSHLMRLNLTGDDLGGRDFLYPSCSGGGGSTPPPSPPPPSEPPAPSPPPVAPPPSSGGSGDLASYDSNSNCVLDEPEFFSLVDGWISGSVENSLFFEGVDAWISQGNICSAASQSLQNSTLVLRSSGYSSLFVAQAELRIEHIEIFALNGKRILSDMPDGSTFVWRHQERNGSPVANGVYFAVVLTRDARSGMIYREIHKFAIIR